MGKKKMTQKIKFTGITKCEYNIEHVGEYVNRRRVCSEMFYIHGNYFPDDNNPFNTWIQLSLYWIPEIHELRHCGLRFGRGYESAGEIIFFERNRPIRIEASKLFGGNRPISEDYLRTDERYRTMIGFIPEAEPIKPILEHLVK